MSSPAQQVTDDSRYGGECITRTIARHDTRRVRRPKPLARAHRSAVTLGRRPSYEFRLEGTERDKRYVNLAVPYLKAFSTRPCPLLKAPKPSLAQTFGIRQHPERFHLRMNSRLTRHSN